MVILASMATIVQAGTVNVVTSGGAGSPWTVADPDFGNYTVSVSVSGGGYAQSPSNSLWYYRNSSGNGEEDATITWAVSGLPTGVIITDFALDNTQVAPGTGSGNGSYDLTLSGTGSSGTVSDVRSSTDILTDFVPVSPDLSISDASFGNAPTFSLSIDEIGANTTRTIGTHTFTITAIPEPSTLALSALGLLSLLACGRRRKR